MNKISLILGIWQQGYFNEKEVIEWSDSQVKSLKEPDNEVIELSLNGPAKCLKYPPYEFPRPINFTFVEKFSLKLMKLDLTSDIDIKTFIRWAVSNAMGENTEFKEVWFCYLLDDNCLNYDGTETISYFKEHITELFPDCKKRVQSFLYKLSA